MAVISEVYDVIIIGGSYAGISAALTLYRATHTCLIFDSGKYRNSSATQTRLTPGWEGQSPENVQVEMRAELEKTGLVDFVQLPIHSAQKQSDGIFEVIDAKGGTWISRKIVLAIGADEIYPAIEGYAENYGRLIFHCMFCFGYELRASSAAGVLATGILSHAGHAITNARDAKKFVDTVIIYTDGNDSLASELLGNLEESMQINNRKVQRLWSGDDDSVLSVEFDSGERENLAFLVHKPDLQVNTTLSDQLGCESIPGLGIKVLPPFNSTNIEGVFAAGDCCSPLRNIPNAMSMGSFVGCGVARELPANGNSRNQELKQFGHSNEPDSHTE